MTISRLKTNREAIYRRVGACCAIAANIGVTALALCALGVTFEFRPTLWTWLLRAVVLWAFVAVVLDIAVVTLEELGESRRREKQVATGIGGGQHAE